MPRLPLFLVLLPLFSLIHAMPQFRARIPNGGASVLPTSGLTCDALGHQQCVPGAPRNPFGLDFKAAGYRWTLALCEKDSDGDGLTNGEELGDPCCEWSEVNRITLRTTFLSHPGDKNDDGAKKAKKCTNKKGDLAVDAQPKPGKESKKDQSKENKSPKPSKSSNPKPSRSAKPSKAPSRKPSKSARPSKAPKPSRSARPSKSSRPSKAPNPNKSARPSKDPKPGKSPRPSKQPKPSKSARPAKSPRPGKSNRPSVAPKPSKSKQPQPSKSARPAKSPRPNKSIRPSVAPKPSKAVKPSVKPSPPKTPVTPDGRIPKKVGRCSGRRNRFTIACVCFATLEKLIVVDKRKMVLKSCVRLLGSKRSIRSLGFSCRRFRNSRGVLNREKIMRRIGVVMKCAGR